MPILTLVRYIPKSAEIKFQNFPIIKSQNFNSDEVLRFKTDPNFDFERSVKI